MTPPARPIGSTSVAVRWRVSRTSPKSTAVLDHQLHPVTIGAPAVEGRIGGVGVLEHERVRASTAPQLVVVGPTPAQAGASATPGTSLLASKEPLAISSHLEGGAVSGPARRSWHDKPAHFRRRPDRT